MAKVWVLDTDTKGTGAQMVPLEKVEKGPAPQLKLTRARRKRPARPTRAAEPSAPPKFKVVDVMTRRVLAEGASARETVDLLEGVASIVDVSIYVWEESAQRWRSLSLGERRKLWRFRGRADAPTAG